MDWERIFCDLGVIKKGHFLLASGLHSDTYFEKFALFNNPPVAEKLLLEMAERIKPLAPEIIVGPTTGGIIIAFEIARILGIRALFAERGENNKRILRRNQTLPEGAPVVVVDDVLTTGGSLLSTVELVKNNGGKVVGAGVMINRGFKGDLAFPLISIYQTEVVAYTPEECPLCKQSIPLEKPGTSR